MFSIPQFSPKVNLRREEIDISGQKQYNVKPMKHTKGDFYDQGNCI